MNRLTDFILISIYLDHTQICSHATTRTVETETTSTAVRIVFAQIEKARLASIATLSFNIGLHKKTQSSKLMNME